MRLLIPAVALAAMTNLRVFRVGTRIFGATVPQQDETGFISKKYLMASVAVLLLFQSLVTGSVGSTRRPRGLDCTSTPPILAYTTVYSCLPAARNSGIGLSGLPR